MTSTRRHFRAKTGATSTGTSTGTSTANSTTASSTTSRARNRACHLLGWSLVCAGAAAPVRAAPGTVADAEARYRQELALCDSGSSNQGRDTCLKEARAAHAEALKAAPGATTAPDPRNASLRCEPLQGDERRDCLARMQDAGTVSGSVAGGGVLRELVTTDVPASTPASAASAAAK
jgi:hypothetical protein